MPTCISLIYYNAATIIEYRKYVHSVTIMVRSLFIPSRFPVMNAEAEQIIRDTSMYCPQVWRLHSNKFLLTTSRNAVLTMLHFSLQLYLKHFNANKSFACYNHYASSNAHRSSYEKSVTVIQF
jgi:hypothetical protein